MPLRLPRRVRVAMGQIPPRFNGVLSSFARDLAWVHREVPEEAFEGRAVGLPLVVLAGAGPAEVLPEADSAADALVVAGAKLAHRTGELELVES